MILFGHQGNIRGRLSYLEDAGWKNVERFHDTWNKIDKQKERITELEERISFQEAAFAHLLNAVMYGSLSPETAREMSAISQMVQKDKSEMASHKEIAREYQKANIILNAAKGKN